MKCNCIKETQACGNCVKERLIDFGDNGNWNYGIEHIDGNGHNNNITNLRYVENLITPKEQQVDFRLEILG